MDMTSFVSSNRITTYSDGKVLSLEIRYFSNQCIPIDLAEGGGGGPSSVGVNKL